MQVSIIAAVADNRAIGKDNDLIWHLPDDMKFFKQCTKGHHVIMGRLNYESIPHNYRPLPNRTNIIITRQANYDAPGCIVLGSLDEALEFAKGKGEEEAFIIGGGQIYGLALDTGVVDTMYITHVHAQPEADVFFPKVDLNDWTAHELASHDIDDRHAHSFDIKQYSRA